MSVKYYVCTLYACIALYAVATKKDFRSDVGKPDLQMYQDVQCVVLEIRTHYPQLCT